jgi:hypothetical protein|tara:strand:+ start:571 stop:717 length:147 start_codon:yes stop_codon:yes gene_type:complete
VRHLEVSAESEEEAIKVAHKIVDGLTHQVPKVTYEKKLKSIRKVKEIN